MGTTATSTSSAGGLSGMIHGGQNPVSGAKVTMWAAGIGGYGATAVQLATTTSSTAGTFTFAPVTGYTCPSTTSTTASQLIYITAAGGQATPGISNANIDMMAAVGACSTLETNAPYVIINEETTVAGMTALNGFFSLSVAGGGSIGAPSTNIKGLTNAFATAANLTTLSTGLSATTTATGAVTGYGTAPVVTITPESAKIALEANILAACVNSDPTATTTCSTLNSDVSATAAVDTLQAAYYMAVNPTSTINGTSNITPLFNLATANNPFAGAASTAPTDWTLALNYSSTSAATSGTVFLAAPEYIAVDASGDLWAVNYVSGKGNVSELSPAGVPLNQVLDGTLNGPAGIALDPSGNVWVPNFGVSATLQTTVAEYVVTGGTTKTYTVSAGPQAIAADGAGNIFVMSPAYKGAGAMSEIPAGTATGTTITPFATGVASDFTNLAVDGNGTVWATGGGTASPGVAGVNQFLYSATAPHYPSSPVLTTAGGAGAVENAIAVGASNLVFAPNYGAETFAEFSGTTSISAATGSPFATSAALTKPKFAAVDGANNVWITQAASGGEIFGYSSTGVAQTPSTGFTHTFGEPYGIAVDASGNIWVGNYSSGTLTEVVGAAVPVVTPIAAGLPATYPGTSTLGTRP